MFKKLGREARTVVISVVAASMVSAAPAAAAIVANAHAVDGKHAVSAAATKKARAGKLVATDSRGYLPSNIIAKAANADRLDGLDSTDFAPAGTQPFAVTGPTGTGTLSATPEAVAAVGVHAPADGILLISAEGFFSALDATGRIQADLRLDGSVERIRYWSPGDVDGYSDQVQTITVALPVTAGDHRVELALRELDVDKYSKFGASITATYLPGRPQPVANR